MGSFLQTLIGTTANHVILVTVLLCMGVAMTWVAGRWEWPAASAAPQDNSGSPSKEPPKDSEQPVASPSPTSPQQDHPHTRQSPLPAPQELGEIPAKDAACYTVGWICAIATEYVAAQAFLDERHGRPKYLQKNDYNDYTLGKIGEHHVVMAVLPEGEYGTSSAATVAKSMLHTFLNVRIGLMVGIGGGAPTSEQDIRLGDIVVSAPCNGVGGVFQYDFGKTIQDQEFRPTGILNQPPMVLQAAVSGLKSQYELCGHQLETTINSALEKNPRLRKKYQRPTYPGNDRLYRSHIVHPAHGKAECHESCGDDASKLELRGDRSEDEDNPAIYYGLVASANQLMKDASIQDKIAAEKGILCFEMEAAGLMNHFPCLVVRGICDYSDSHKSKAWQGYAAMAAAAYARDLLFRISPDKVEAEAKLVELMSDVSEKLSDIHSVTTGTRAVTEKISSDNQAGKIQKWLCPSDSSTNLHEAQSKCHQGTGSWFLQGEQFEQWKSGKLQHLWLHGIPGCGKTVLIATIIEHLREQVDSPHAVLDFFFDFADSEKQSLNSLVRTLVAQLYVKCRSSQNELHQLFLACDEGRRQPKFESLSATFMQMSKSVQKIQIVIDALDECKTRGALLSWMENLARSGHAGLQLLVTSRKEEDIRLELERWLHQLNGAMNPIQQVYVNHDIRLYVHWRLQTDRGFERWHSKPSVQEEIEIELMGKANGMFRWAACQLDILQDCLSLDMLRTSLRCLPGTLEETYARILGSISDLYRPYAIRLLQFLTYSERPLTIQEAVDVIAVKPGENPAFDPELRLQEPREILKICSSLVSLSTWQLGGNPPKTTSELQLAHFSVQQYLQSGRLDEVLPSGSKPMEFVSGLNEITARASIARVCVAYLSQPDPLRPIRDIKADFPLVQYSARSLMSHLKFLQADEGVQNEILHHLFIEQGNAYTVWLELFDPDFPHDQINLFQPSNTPTYYASLAGFRHTVEQLLERGADVNTKDHSKRSALYAASANAHQEIVQLLLERGADVNAMHERYGSALHVASQKGHREIVQLLLERGADINAKHSDTEGDKAALHVASDNGHWETVQLLLDRGADINSKNEFVGSALNFALLNGHSKVVWLLLEKGADITVQGVDFGGTLQFASAAGNIEVVQLLLERGADVNAQCGFFGNALQLASYRGYRETVQILLERGADVNTQGGHIGSPLQAASISGHQEIVQLLLERGADINAKCGRWGSALHGASSKGLQNIVQLLLERGADAKLSYGQFGSALQAASDQGHLDIVQMLLESGAKA